MSAKDPIGGVFNTMSPPAVETPAGQVDLSQLLGSDTGQIDVKGLEPDQLRSVIKSGIDVINELRTLPEAPGVDTKRLSWLSRRKYHIRMALDPTYEERQRLKLLEAKAEIYSTAASAVTNAYQQLRLVTQQENPFGEQVQKGLASEFVRQLSDEAKIANLQRTVSLMEASLGRPLTDVERDRFQQKYLGLEGKGASDPLETAKGVTSLLRLGWTEDDFRAAGMESAAATAERLQGRVPRIGEPRDPTIKDLLQVAGTIQNLSKSQSVTRRASFDEFGDPSGSREVLETNVMPWEQALQLALKTFPSIAGQYPDIEAATTPQEQDIEAEIKAEMEKRARAAAAQATGAQ